MNKRTKEKPEATASAAAPELADLVARGDNRAARARARQILAAPASGESDRAAARDILARTGFEPAALISAAAALSVIAAMAALVYLR
jgi:hypothetical protein